MNNYIVSLTTIPTRINFIEKTIKSLVEQTLKPSKIILNIPKKYNFRFKGSLDYSIVKKKLGKYKNDVIINNITEDYGPGSKILGLLENKILKDEHTSSTFIVLVDDDHIYKPYMLEYFDSCNKRNNYKLKTASFFCYKNNNIIIGQGSDSYFIKLELLNQFKEYYNIIKNYDYVNYHDDHYISYYFHLKKIPIVFIKPPHNSLIYDQHKNSNIDSLVSIENKYNRNNLNLKLNEIMTELDNGGKFDNIKKEYLNEPTTTTTPRNTDSTKMKVNAYVINLRRREDRFKSFLKNYPLDTKISKFEAIDGKTLLNIPNYFKDRLPGEVGCFLSHKSLWERTVKNEHCDLSLVFEDDVKFSTCFLEKFNCVLNDLRAAKISQFDTILYIGGRFTECYKMQNSKKVTDVIVKFDYNMPWKSWDCDRTTHAYIISKKCCQLLLNEFYKKKQIPGFVFPPVDIFIMHILRLNRKDIFHTFPLLCYSDVNSESDIGPPLR